MTGVSGVRGVFADSLNPEIVLRYAARFGEYIKANSLNPSPKPKIVVGRDSRTTGPAMLSTVVSALLSVGCDVVEIGIVPTPTVLLNVKKTLRPRRDCHHSFPQSAGMERHEVR